MSDNIAPSDPGLTPPVQTEAFTTDYEKSHAKFTEQRRAAMAKTKPILFGVLKSAGITRVVVTFDGAGDSGQIETVDAFGAADETLDLPTDAITCTFAEMYPTYEPCDEHPSGSKFVGYAVREVKKSAPVQGIIEYIFWEFIGDKHGGWEDNDGGFGECHFDVADEIIRLEMNERYTETNYYEHEL